jgi:hypothetical protein
VGGHQGQKLARRSNTVLLHGCRLVVSVSLEWRGTLDIGGRDDAPFQFRMIDEQEPEHVVGEVATGALDSAPVLLARSLEEAAIADARYEKALTLLISAAVEHALGGDAITPRQEAAIILSGLDVVTVPGWYPPRIE